MLIASTGWLKRDGGFFSNKRFCLCEKELRLALGVGLRNEKKIRIKLHDKYIDGSSEVEVCCSSWGPIVWFDFHDNREISEYLLNSARFKKWLSGREGGTGYLLTEIPG